MQTSHAATLIELPAAGVLLAQGPQAVDLLHAQLTQDLRNWPDGSARMAAMCTPQGRMLADFLLWREADGSIALLLDATVLEATLKRLRMFILRLQCSLRDASAQRRVFGLLEPSEAAIDSPRASLAMWQLRHDAGVTEIRLPDAPGLRRVLLVAHGEAGLAELRSRHAGLAAAGEWDWKLAEIRAGIGHVGAATTQRFVPQMLNYEALGAIDFHKGCYPGQEVVARTQYRGAVKRRTFPVRSEQPMAAGDEVFSTDDPEQPCGMIVGAAPAGGGRWEALAELKLSALEHGELRLRGADGAPLQRGELPYALPVEA